MDERHTAAALALVAGKSIEEAAKAAHRVPKTIYQWAEEPEFAAVVLRGIKARALVTLVYWAHGQCEEKEGKAALAIMRWMGASKPKPGKPKDPEADEDETDLSDFSKEQLERFEGDE